MIAKLSAACLLAAALGSSAHAMTMTETFDNPFVGWETRFFGANSNAQECYGSGGYRGNNPDGLWVSTTGQGCSGTPVAVGFTAPFAASLTGLAFDVAGYATTTLTFFDKNNAVLSSTPVTLTHGAYSLPGVYSHYSVTSANGIGGFSFSGQAAGNTSIDNVVATTGGTVPEPASWALMLAGFGLIGLVVRRRAPIAA